MKKQSNTPHIRFQNYEDEWVDSKIGRHISLLNGRAYKQEELLDGGKYKVLRVGNFNTNSKWYYSNLELEENKYVNLIKLISIKITYIFGLRVIRTKSNKILMVVQWFILQKI